MRLPVVPQLSTKDGVQNKNARLTNALKEVRQTGELAAVRPGLVESAQATGTGNGIVSFNNELVSVYGSTVGVSVIPGTSVVTVYPAWGPFLPLIEWFIADYLNSQFITFAVDEGLGELQTLVGSGTSFSTASYGLVTGNEARSAGMSATAYVVATRDAGAGYGSLMEVYRTSTSGTPSFSLVKSSNSYSAFRGECTYLNGMFVLPCEDAGVSIGARIYSSSDDGVTWISTNIAGFRPAGATWDGTRWIIYGCDLNDTNPRAYYSTDLITFNALALSGLSPDFIPIRVEKIGGIYLARCFSTTQLIDNLLYTSTDGVAWTMASDPQFMFCYNIKTIGSYVYLSGTDAIYPYTTLVVMRTIDGVNWDLVCSPAASQAHGMASDGTNLIGISLFTSNWFYNVVTAPTIPPVGTVTGDHFDFTQSPI